MKTKHNFRHSSPCCINCKHSYFFDPGRLYSPMDAIYNKTPYNTTVYYCNVEKECPLKTQEEFTEYGNGEFDPDSPVTKWLNLEDTEDPESTERYVGTGFGICDLYESKNYDNNKDFEKED